MRYDSQQIATFCRKWKIVEFALFGSALREDFGPDSDVDVLVSFADEAAWQFEHLDQMRQELEALFQRQVDLVERRVIERSRNYLRRRAILSNARVVYAA